MTRFHVTITYDWYFSRMFIKLTPSMMPFKKSNKENIEQNCIFIWIFLTIIYVKRYHKWHNFRNTKKFTRNITYFIRCIVFTFNTSKIGTNFYSFLFLKHLSFHKMVHALVQFSFILIVFPSLYSSLNLEFTFFITFLLRFIYIKHSWKKNCSLIKASNLKRVTAAHRIIWFLCVLLR